MSRLERLNDRYHENPAALAALLGDFDDVTIRFAVGRYLRLHARLMARVQVFSARKPG